MAHSLLWIQKEARHAAKIQFGLYYPATLQFTHNGKRIKFTDSAEALTYINNNVSADDGHSALHAAENGDWGNIDDWVHDANSHLKETVISFDMVILSYFLTAFIIFVVLFY